MWCGASNSTFLTCFWSMLPVRPRILLLMSWFSIDLTWKLLRNAVYVSSLDPLNQHLHFSKTSSDLCAHENMRKASLEHMRTNFPRLGCMFPTCTRWLLLVSKSPETQIIMLQYTLAVLCPHSLQLLCNFHTQHLSGFLFPAAYTCVYWLLPLDARIHFVC